MVSILHSVVQDRRIKACTAEIFRKSAACPDPAAQTISGARRNGVTAAARTGDGHVQGHRAAI
jgi:hypothetical protein